MVMREETIQEDDVCMQRDGGHTVGRHTRKAVKPRRRSAKLFVVLAMLAVALLVGGGTFVYAANITLDYSWYTQDTTADTFTISTAGQLMAFSDLVSGLADTDGDGYPEAAVDFAGKTVKLGGNIIMAGVDFYPIGTADNPFEGTFDGAGKTIAYLTLTQGNDYNNPYSYVGLFGYTGAQSSLKNVTLEDSCTVAIANTDTDQTVAYVGALVGYSEGSIEGCTSRARVSVSWDDGNAGDSRSAENAVVIDSVAGVAGVCDGDITDTSFTGELRIYTPANAHYDTTTTTTVDTIVTYVAGVVGRSGGDLDTAGQGIHGDIENCTNGGDIAVFTTGEGGTDRFGEVVEAKSGYIGGIAGCAIGNIATCENTADIITSSYAPDGIDTALSLYRDTETTAVLRPAGGGDATGGIVGSLRSTISSTGLSTTGTDAGITGKEATGQADGIAVTDCTNTGYISALHNVGGIVGVAGTYTTIERCTNGDATKTTRDEWLGRIRSTRWNKPLTGGIAGCTYGTIAYCRNHAEVETTQGGYYTGGICGYTNYYATAENVAAHPEPEIYGCYNTGQVHSNVLYNSDTLNKEGSLIGGNNGYIHDCLFLYGTLNKSEDPLNAAIGENYGTYARCTVAFATASSAQQYGGEDSIVLTTSTATAHLNAMAPSIGWNYYWLTNAALNKGYPVLSTEADADGVVDLVALDPTVTLVANAQYTAAYNPTPEVKVVVTVNGEEVTLTENADYYVVGDGDALGDDGICKGITATGEAPYTASIVGIGVYAGEVADCVSYGIGKGEFGECTLSAATVTYAADSDGNGIAQNDPKVTIVDASGGIISSDDYDSVVNNGDDCIAAGAYTVVATAKDTSNYVGYTQGTYTIGKIDLARDCDVVGITYDNRVWYYDEERYELYEVIPVLDDNGNLIYDSDTGYPLVKTAQGATYVDDDGKTMTKADPRYTDEEGNTVYGMDVDYTGASINPEVIALLWNGVELQPRVIGEVETGYSWCVIYGNGDDLSGAGALPNIETDNGGTVIVRYGAALTKNYVVLNFEISTAQVSANDITVTQDLTALLYNDGDAIDIPSVTVTYKGNVVDASNYTLTPAYSLVGGTKYEGAAMTYNVGDSLYYTLSFNDGASIVCDDIEVGPWTLLEGQIDINTCTATVEDQVYTFAGVSYPDVEVRSASGELLMEGSDYSLRYVYATYPENDSKWSKPTVFITGMNDYAGTKTVTYHIARGKIQNSTFVVGSESYEELHAESGKIAYCGGTYGGWINGLSFPYRVNGYSADDFAEVLGLAWLNNSYNQERKQFKVTAIYNASGEKIDTAADIGTYTLVLAADPDATSTYFEIDPDFSYTCQVEITPVSLNSDSYAQFSSGLSLRLAVTSDLYNYDATVYPYTGNPILPRYQILDFEASLRDTSESDLSRYAFSEDDYYVTIEGYGTVGPTEIGEGYTVVAIAAREDSSVLYGGRSMPSFNPNTFNIVAADISDPEVVEIAVADVTYNGSALEPEACFYIDGILCNYVEGEDYSLTYDNNIDPGEATVTITILNGSHLTATDDAGNMTSSITVPFTIEAAPTTLDAEDNIWNLSDTISLKEGSTTGEIVDPAVSGTYIIDGDIRLPIPSNAYTVETGTYDGTAFTSKTNGFNVGEQVYFRMSANGSNGAFVGSTIQGPVLVVAVTSSNSFTQVGQTDNALTVMLSTDSILPATSFAYTGAQITPQVSVTDGLTELVEGVDYTLSSGANTEVATGGSVTVTGKGAYTGACTIPFAIAPASLSDCEVDVASQTYTGSALYPAAEDIEVSLDGQVLDGSDWQVDSAGYGTNTVVGSAGNTVRVASGTSGNLTGSKDVSFEIMPIGFASSRMNVTVADKTYTGAVVRPAADDVSVIDTETGTTLQYGIDYTLSVANAINAGSATYYVSGKGNYTSTLAGTFTIQPADIGTASIAQLTDAVYTGAAIKPTPIVSWNGKELGENDDYTVSYEDNITAGVANVKVTGCGNFSGSTYAVFTIAPASLADATLDIDATYIYTGAQVDLGEEVVVGGVALPADDYTLTFSPDGISLGMQTVTATPKSTNVTGSVSATFEIVKGDIADAAIADIPAHTYAFGAVITPKPVVTSPKGAVLSEGEDYTLSYVDNTAIGTATVTVAGAGSWEGSVSATFKITKISLSTADVSFTGGDTYAYTGDVIEPVLTIATGGRTLTEGTDYTLSYLGNKTSVGAQTIEVVTPDSSVYDSSITVTYYITEQTAQSVQRIEGDDRYQTAAAAARAAYPQGASGVIIATGTNFPDALAAAGLAGMLGYPILLAAPDALPASTSEAIVSLGASEVIICGGTGALSATVSSSLASLVGADNVTRLAGDDRYATAQAIYDYGTTQGTWANTAVIATGANYPDALAISSYAAWAGSPIFLVQKDTLPDAVREALEEGGFTSTVVAGGTGVVSSGVVTSIEEATGNASVRLGGDDRYGTSSLVASWAVESTALSWNGVGIATGKNYPDALAGSALLGRSGTVLLLADEGSTSALTTLGANKGAISLIRFLGGTGAVTQGVRLSALAELGWSNDVLQ